MELQRWPLSGSSAQEDNAKGLHVTCSRRTEKCCPRDKESLQGKAAQVEPGHMPHRSVLQDTLCTHLGCEAFR